MTCYTILGSQDARMPNIHGHMTQLLGSTKLFTTIAAICHILIMGDKVHNLQMCTNRRRYGG